MDESPDDGVRPVGASGADRRQLLLVALCCGGLVVAAFLAPPTVDPSTPGDDSTGPSPQDRGAAGDRGGGGGAGGDGGSSGGGDGGDGSPGGNPNGPGDASDGDEPRGGDGTRSDDGSRGENGGVVGEGGDPIPIPGEGALADVDGCAVLLTERPVPGSKVTVRVFDDARPVAGARVRFDGDPVGRTDEQGNVTGLVPYDRTLSISVDAGGADACDFYRERYDDPAAVRPLAAGVGGGLSIDDSSRRSQARSGNATGNYSVSGRVDVAVSGDPYPGSRVTIRAHVSGVPVRDGTVTTDGQRLGETDAEGRYVLRVPEREETTVTVSRGDFAGTATVDVLHLAASVRPLEGLPFPGEPARANVTLDDEPAAGADVSLGGRGLGSTTSDGAVEFGLPTDPTAAVTVRTARQTVRVPLWQVYLPTGAGALLLAVVGFATTLGARRVTRPATARRVTLGWAAVGVSYAALVVGEGRGLRLSLAAIAVLGLYRRRHRVRAGGETTAGVLAGAARTVRRLAFAITLGLERVLDRLRVVLARLASRLRAILRSPRDLPAVLRDAFRRIAKTVRSHVTVYRLVFLGMGVVVVVAATVRWHARGFLASLAGFTCVIAALAAWQRGDANPGRVETQSVQRQPVASDESVDAEATVVSIRALYRRFARWVLPGDWRTRTPGEVSRAAIDRGLAREPVETLTGAFRAVEYGGESPETRRERASAAFDRLAETRHRGDDEHRDGATQPDEATRPDGATPPDEEVTES